MLTPGPRPQHHLVSAPPHKRQKKSKDKVLPLEPMTEEPAVREPRTAAEKEEIEQWKAERRKHFPTRENLAKREAEGKARAERGEQELQRQERAARLQEILLKQRELGVDKLAGTQDLMAELGGHGRAPGDRGRARGRGRGPMSRRPHPGQAREEREGPSGPPTEPGSKVETAQGLAGLVGYDSDSLASGQPEERGRGEAAGQDHSYVLQAFRFFVQNEFLADWVSGKTDLIFPEAPKPEPAKQISSILEEAEADDDDLVTDISGTEASGEEDGEEDVSVMALTPSSS
ncbi:hypothetical protein F751_3107 [Auxenochlorella protothecoides]|uniref:FMR1-interacting protein 1 conserved domain-containing protein n=1 Tax=Auxenochlorella protothecoides TaxID=3075 RepID=A0A087SF85_AUXPR|nr:hypothetical protein F751_3107 [Auxenochlorella protothecoides]KFM24389.1 hypothetical protein F751_3107 [Auxenochlorella protothecoides]